MSFSSSIPVTTVTTVTTAPWDFEIDSASLASAETPAHVPSAASHETFL
jgi:hypothetical protein